MKYLVSAALGVARSSHSRRRARPQPSCAMEKATVGRQGENDYKPEWGIQRAAPASRGSALAIFLRVEQTPSFELGKVAFD